MNQRGEGPEGSNSDATSPRCSSLARYARTFPGVLVGGIDAASTAAMKLDSSRDKYGIQSIGMAKMFAELNFPRKKGEWYDRLFDYTDPEKNAPPVRNNKNPPCR